MTKLKLIAVPDEKPMKMTIELPASTHRDLIQYGEILASQTGQAGFDPTKLVAQMVAKFMIGDRAFVKLKKITQSRNSV